MPVVIDASALVELLLHSERAPAVLQAVGTTDMVAPDGIDAEVLSMLRRFERTGKLPAKRASQAVEDLPTCGCLGLPSWAYRWSPSSG